MQTKRHTYSPFTFRAEDLLGRKPIVLDLQNSTQEIKGRNILITGAAGTIGAELTKQVCACGPSQVVLIDQGETALYELELSIKHQFPQVNICCHVASITDALRMAELFSQTCIHIIFHAAAYKHVPFMERHPYEAIRTNIFGTEILADLAVSYRVRKFIFISTDKAIKPASVMGATKRFAELYLQYLSREYPGQTRFIVTRFGNVLGSNGSFLNRFANQISEGGPVTVTHPRAERYLMTVTEACQLVLQAIAAGNDSEVLSFDMGSPVRIVDVAQKLIRLAGLEPGADIQICFTGLRPGEKLTEEVDEATLEIHSFGPLRSAHFTDPAGQRMRHAMSTLQTALNSGQTEQMVGILKAMIPEYISANSPFEQLDNINTGEPLMTADS